MRTSRGLYTPSVGHQPRVGADSSYLSDGQGRERVADDSSCASAGLFMTNLPHGAALRLSVQQPRRGVTIENTIRQLEERHHVYDIYYRRRF